MRVDVRGNAVSCVRMIGNMWASLCTEALRISAPRRATCRDESCVVS